MTEITLPTVDEVRLAHLHADRAAALAANPQLGQPQPKSETAALLREHHEREHAELERFQTAIAAHFQCAAMLDPRMAGQLKPLFQELRLFAHQRNGEAARRAADPTTPAPVRAPDAGLEAAQQRRLTGGCDASGRDAHGRFTGRR